MAYIDPATGGLKFIEKSESLNKQQDTMNSINAAFKPQKSR